MKNSTIMGIVLVVVVIGLFTSGILSFLGLGDSKTIDVSESATVTKEANRVILTVGIDTQADTASEAESQNSVVSDEIYSFLDSLGLQDDYETESYNVYPNRNWEINEVNGYSVNHMVKIDTEQVDLAGEIYRRRC